MSEVIGVKHEIPYIVVAVCDDVCLVLHKWRIRFVHASAGPGSQTAPAALQQMRHSVLQCIDQLASIGTGRSIWKGMTDKVAEAVALYLDNTQTCAVKEAAAQARAACTSSNTQPLCCPGFTPIHKLQYTVCLLSLCHFAAHCLLLYLHALKFVCPQALLSVAKDDPDTVWMVLHLLLGAHELDGKTNPNPVLFPDACRLLQTQGTSSASAGVDDLRLFVSNLLRKIETIPASWQSHCVD